MTGIYFHIPFCARKCPYCDFYSVPFRRDGTDSYVRAVLRNIEGISVSDTVDTIYFGGGTPSLLSLHDVEQILTSCRSHFTLAENTEITMEWNPTGKRAAHLRELFRLGVNRLSIGTQSFSDRQLHILGRTHCAEDGLRTVMDAHDAGFTNISCDLILACPEQTGDVLDETLNVLTSLPITHVSAYLLQVEDGTPLSRNGELLRRLPEEDAAADLYLHTVQILSDAGLLQYEVSSFARPGYESRHNVKYWECQPYLGIGAGAHSCFGGSRFCVPKDITAFCDSPLQPIELLDDSPCGREEQLMLALRTVRGVPLSAFRKSISLQNLQNAGYIRIRKDRLSLTPEGFAVSNAVIAALLAEITE